MGLNTKDIVIIMAVARINKHRRVHRTRRQPDNLIYANRAVYYYRLSVAARPRELFADDLFPPCLFSTRTVRFDFIMPPLNLHNNNY